MDFQSPRIRSDAGDIRKRFDTLCALYYDEFTVGLGTDYCKNILLSKELLHCAVNAYYDDISKYKAYAGSEFADRHKQAAFTMVWLSRFKPIQINDNIRTSPTYLTINESFAIYAALTFLNPSVAERMTESFYRHLIYTLTYRDINGRTLATILYLMEKAAESGTKF